MTFYQKGISLVIPVLDEESNVSDLTAKILEVFEKSNIQWEVIWVDDASKDHTYKKLSEMEHSKIQIIRNSFKIGQSSSIYKGFLNSKYSMIATMDGDGQNDPHDLLEMLTIIEKNPTLDFIQGIRVKRKDNFFQRILLSKLANWIIRLIIGVKIQDLGCGTKLFKREVIESIPLRGEMHRLYAAHAYVYGFKVSQLPVNHYPRKFGKSKYGYTRIFKFLFDLLFLKFQFQLQTRPIYLFGKLSALFMSSGLILLFSAFILLFLKIKNYLDVSLIVGSLILFSLSIISIFLGMISDLILRMKM